jgi:uncharacterized membrane protein
VLKNISSPEKFVIITLLSLGLIACLSIPLSAGYDEETHFVRAWEMAHLYFIPNEQLGARLPFPALYWELSYRRQPIVDAVAPGFWARYGGLRMDAHDYVYANVETRSVYSPVLLLPQAFVLRYLGLSLQLPALVVYYACRIIGLLSYLLLGWLAVRLIPYGKWLLAVLIVSPMALFQASTISADTISNGIGFLFLGAALSIAVRKEITWRTWAALLGLIALLFVAKVNLIYLAALPFLLIPPSRFKMRFGFALLAAAVLVLFLVEIAGWNIVAYSKFTRALQGASPALQLRFIGSNPLLFVQVLAGDIWTNTLAYMQGWVGVYGYNYWPVPALTYVLYPLAAVLSLALPASPQMPDRRTRMVLASLFVVGFLLTIASLYLAFTPVGSLFVAGVQGRYFTVVMPLLFLALLGLTLRNGLQPGRRSQATQVSLSPTAPVVLASAALLLFTAGLVLSYHVSCGSEYYRWSLCYQPAYKNWAPGSLSSAPISPAFSLTQEIVPACDGMTELSVWVNSNGTDSAGTTTLAVRAPTEQKDVVQQTLTNAAVPRDGWLTVRFAPEWQSNNQLYLVTLKGSAAGGIQVGYSDKSEYLKGKLLENQTPVAQDILFQYGCVAGLQRLAGVGR